MSSIARFFLEPDGVARAVAYIKDREVEAAQLQRRIKLSLHAVHIVSGELYGHTWHVDVRTGEGVMQMNGMTRPYPVSDMAQVVAYILAVNW